MFNDAKDIGRVYIACGYTDLRYGIDGLAGIVKQHFNLDPFTPKTLFLFCGRRTNRIKGLLWEEDGFLLLYKRLEAGKFRWPRTSDEIQQLTPEQYIWLMQGLELEHKKLIRKVAPEMPL